MDNKSVRKRDLAAATRGLIVQRVLVDGRSLAEAGAPFDLEERDVARLVAAYRQHGMAALRGEAAAGRGPWRWIKSCFGWIGARRRRDGAGTESAARRHRLAPEPPVRPGAGTGGANTG